MKLTRDKTALVYNDFLTLEGIPSETFEYRLGNRPDDPQYIVRFIAQAITVSLETVKLVKVLPPLSPGPAEES